MEQSNMVARKKELVSEIAKIKENIELRSREKDVEYLEKMRNSNDSWSTHYSEGKDRYEAFASSYRDQKEALEIKKSKLKSGFFIRRLFNSSKIAELDKEIRDLDRQIEIQEANAKEQELKAERQQMVHDTTYNRNDIWEFLQSRGLTEETFKEKLKTIPDMETLNKTLAELERELESIDISLEVYDEGIETKLQESINKVINYNLENPDNVVPNTNIGSDSQIEDEEEHTRRSK